MRLRTIRNSRWQDMTKKELAMITIKSGAVTLVTAWLYYRSFWMLLPLLPVWAWHFKMMAEEVARKKIRNSYCSSRKRSKPWHQP